DQTGNISSFILLANPPLQPAGAIISKDQSISGIGHKDIGFTNGNTGEISLLARGRPGLTAPALAVENLDLFTQTDVQRAVLRYRHAAHFVLEGELRDLCSIRTILC